MNQIGNSWGLGLMNISQILLNPPSRYHYHSPGHPQVLPELLQASAHQFLMASNPFSKQPCKTLQKLLSCYLGKH